MRLEAIWDTALVVAGVASVLKLLEVFLSDTQKQWLADRTVRLWHWLAEAKQQSLLHWLQGYRRFSRLITRTGVILVSIYMVWAFEKALAPICLSSTCCALHLWGWIRSIETFLVVTLMPGMDRTDENQAVASIFADPQPHATDPRAR
jgi:hypothetical protein